MNNLLGYMATLRERNGILPTLVLSAVASPATIFHGQLFTLWKNNNFGTFQLFNFQTYLQDEQDGKG